MSHTNIKILAFKKESTTVKTSVKVGSVDWRKIRKRKASRQGTEEWNLKLCRPDPEMSGLRGNPQNFDIFRYFRGFLRRLKSPRRETLYYTEYHIQVWTFLLHAQMGLRDNNR